MNKSIGEIQLRDMKSIGRVEKFIEEVCDYYNIGDEYFANVMLGISEAVRLMMERRTSAHDDVHIEGVKTGKGIKFIIRTGQKGENAELDALEHALEQEKLTRQLFIIKSLADDLKVMRHGRKLEINYYITTLNAEKSLYRVKQLKERL